MWKKNINTNLKNLESWIKENGRTNEKNMILKMDIEKLKQESLIDIKEGTLNRFKFITNGYHFDDERRFQKNNLYYNVFKKFLKLIRYSMLDVMVIEII